MHKFLETT